MCVCLMVVEDGACNVFKLHGDDNKVGDINGRKEVFGFGCADISK